MMRLIALAVTQVLHCYYAPTENSKKKRKEKIQEKVKVSWRKREEGGGERKYEKGEGGGER